MLERIFAELGPWNWMVLGFALLVFEILVPGVFLLWIGIAALIIGTVSLAIWDAGFWIWQVQVIAFLVLALVAAFTGKKIMTGRGDQSDQPLLNRRAEQLVGRIATLSEPIQDGRGRLQIDDTVWRITGPDLAVGAKVRVAKVSPTELELIVEPA